MVALWRISSKFMISCVVYVSFMPCLQNLFPGLVPRPGWPRPHEVHGDSPLRLARRLVISEVYTGAVA